MRTRVIPAVWLLASAAGITAAVAQTPGPAIQGPAPTLENPGINVTTSAPGSSNVLTPAGTLVVEPSVQYMHTSVNTFVAGGVAILDTVLVGNIQATQASQDAITGMMSFRYGVTNRFEADAIVPYMYRTASTTNTIVSSNNTTATTSAQDSALGDVEGSLHYQVNDGDATWPIFVTNLRVKSDTGTSPFDVRRNPLGIAEQLATGSGFWGIEPSVTMIAPSDPAVFFVNAGYLYNLPSSENATYSSALNITSVDPGGAFRMGFGMGIALNDKISYSIGYQEDFIASSRLKFSNGTAFETANLSVGILNLGIYWQMNPKSAMALNVGVGVTRDAPDVSLTARVPFSLPIF